MDQIVLLMSVGPGAMELARLRDFLPAIFHWEPAVRSVVFIDDALEPRGLAKAFDLPSGVSAHSILHPRRGEGSGVWGGLVEGILLGLARIATHEPPGAAVLKIDTDALVIAPFADKASACFQAYSKVGMIGLYDRHCFGAPRSFQPWDRATLNHSLPVGTQRAPGGGRRLRLQVGNAYGTQRRIFSLARANGYRWGEHCLGGAYLLRGQTVRDLHGRGLLQHARFWRDSAIGEDVIVGAYVKAAGWDLRGFAAAREIFGIAYVGLPSSPEELEASGYSIIHSVKNDARQSEDQIRRYFQRRRVRLVPEPVPPASGLPPGELDGMDV